MGRPGFTEFLDRYNQGLSVKKKFIVSWVPPRLLSLRLKSRG
jgi:hypothetical protein